MAGIIIKSSLMTVFGFFLQNVLSEFWNLIPVDLPEPADLEYLMIPDLAFPESSIFGIVSNKTLMNLTIPEEYWDITWAERYEILRELLSNYSIENEKSTFGWETEIKSVLLHLKQNNQDKSGQTGETIFYATKHFDPVYNLDTGRYDFSEVDFLIDHSYDHYNDYFSSRESPLLSRIYNSNDVKYFEKYDDNGYLTFFRFVYRENLTITIDNGYGDYDDYQIQATVILVGHLDAKIFCSGENCSTPKTLNGTENLISKLEEGKIRNFSKLNFSRTESKCFLFFDGNSTCKPNEKYFNTCFVISNITKGEIYLYYANSTSKERAIVTLSKSSSEQTALTISNFTQDHLLKSTVIFIEGNQKPEFKPAKNFELDAEIFLLYERKDLKLNYSYDKMEILGASWFNPERCKQFDYPLIDKNLSQQIIVCEVINESHAYFIYKVILS